MTSMTTQCQHCNKEFEAKRATAKYCSGACRKAAFMAVTVTVEAVPTVSVPGEKRTNGSQEWRDQPGDGSVFRKCKGCDRNETKYCICSQCIDEKKTHRTLGLRCCPDSVPTPEQNRNMEAARAVLHDTLTAQQVHEAGVTVPKWKRHYKTKGEALAALHQAMQDLGYQKNQHGIYTTEGNQQDYSEWH